jgi:Histone deacetylase domain
VQYERSASPPGPCWLLWVRAGEGRAIAQANASPGLRGEAPGSALKAFLQHDKACVDGVFAGTINNGFETRDDRFHHAGYADGGGYCTFNGIMVAVAKYIAAHPGAKVGILDCDLHYGDGTDDILKRKPALASQVIHRTSGKYFHDGNDPLELFPWLHHSIEEINAFGCDVVIYQAGADMHVKDLWAEPPCVASVRRSAAPKKRSVRG